MTALAPAAAPDRRLMQGVALMVAFAALVPAMDVLAKLATAEATPAQVAFARFALQAALSVPILLWLGRLAWPERGDLRLHAARGALMAVATVFFFTALTEMAVADAIAIFFVEPMILTLLSALLLREQVGWRRYAACAVGFLGALLVIQPKFAAFGWLAAAPLGAALCFALHLIITRRLAQRLDGMSMQFWAGLFGTLTLGLALGVGAAAGSESFRFAPLSGYVWSLIVAMGVFGMVGHLAIVAAFARAPASMLAPFQYLEIVMATALGFLVFGDFPDALTWLGIAVIVGSGLVIFHRERAQSRRPIATNPASGSR